MFMSHKILVTGGAGYIGSHIVHALLDAGRLPVVIDNLSTGTRAFVPDNVPFLEADIIDAHKVEAFIREQSCTSVIHLAGSINVEESTQDPLGYYYNNTCASHALIRSCVAQGIKHFIFSSSAAVYGNPDDMQVSEVSQTNPISPYGWSKLMTEKMLEDVCKVEEMNSISLRYFNVAGADPKGRCGMMTKNATHLIKALCETALGLRPSFSIFGDDYDTPDGTCIRDFIHVSDLADAHVAALNYLGAGHGSETINCGYGAGFSVRQVVDTAEQVNGDAINTQVDPRRSGDIVSMVADVTKMRACLDWAPRHNDLGKIIQSSLDWERNPKPSQG